MHVYLHGTYLLLLLVIIDKAHVVMATNSSYTAVPGASRYNKQTDDADEISK